MMKKWISLLLVAAVALSVVALPTLAEEKAPGLVIVEETLTQREENVGLYYYAKIVNKGDSEAAVGKLALSTFGEGEALLTKSEYIVTSPAAKKLQPGEHIYAYTVVYDDRLSENNVKSFKAELSPTDMFSSFRIEPCEGKYVELPNALKDAELHITYTNQGQEAITDYTVVAAVYDKNEKLLFVGDRAVNVVDVHPGSTITVKVGLPFDLVEKWAAEEIEVGKVDAIFYVREGYSYR